MKRAAIVAIILGTAWMAFSGTPEASAYSTSTGGAWTFNMNFGTYDYYGRQSTGFFTHGAIDFRSALAPYGAWLYAPELGGHVWIPYAPSGWRPYTYGAWTYTVHGWTWVAYEPWGWIPHHYGNWIYHPFYQWVWVPGYNWAPAHVIWGNFNGYYGWAPLPPRHTAYYRSNTGYSRDRSYHWYSRSSYPGNYRSGRPGDSYSHGRGQDSYPADDHYGWVPNEAWVIVSSNQFMSDNIADVAVSPGRNMQVIDNRSFSFQTTPPPKNAVERDIRRSIPTTPVDEVRKTVNGNEIKVVRPQQINSARSQKIQTVRQQFSPDQVQRNKRPEIQQQAPQQPAPQRNIQPAPQRNIQPAPQQNIPPRSITPPARQYSQPGLYTPLPRQQPPESQTQEQLRPAPQSNQVKPQQPAAPQRQARPGAPSVRPTVTPVENSSDQSNNPAGLTSN